MDAVHINLQKNTYLQYLHDICTANMKIQTLVYSKVK